MGQYLTAAEVRTRFAWPLSELAAGFEEFCGQGEKAYRMGEIARPDLLLNDVLAGAAVGRLRKLLREASGKLDDAVAGVYRYRKVEAKRLRQPRPGRTR